MNELKNVNLVLFLTQGVPLRTWYEIGIFEREVALYRRLLPHMKGITFVSYGDAGDLSFKERLGGIEVVCNHMGLPKFLYSILLPFLLSKRKLGPCVVKTNQIPGAEVALSSAQKLKAPFIVRFGQLASYIQGKRNGQESFLASHSRAIESRVFPPADCIVTTAPFLRDLVSEKYDISRNKISIIPNYVDTDLFRPMKEVDTTPRRICFIGRLHPEKNLLALIEAVSGVPDTELLLVGEGAIRGELERHAQNLGATVRFKGIVPNVELPEILNSSAMLVLPSLYEGHPKVLIEAMACGLPVIGTDVDGIRDLIQPLETGYLCGTSAGEIRDAIRKVLDDGEMAGRIGDAARRYAQEEFSLNALAERELSLYAELIGKPAQVEPL